MPSSSIKRRRTYTRSSRSAAPQHRPRTHAFTGCKRCRDRHVKCDLGTPRCNNCTRLSLNCEGYHRKYSWMTPKISGEGLTALGLEVIDDIHEIQTSRRLLFSDQERCAMTISMRNECCKNSLVLDLDQILRDLQEKAIEVNDFFRIGPFGVLSTRRGPTLHEVDMMSPENVNVVEDVTQEENSFSPAQFTSFVPQLDQNSLENSRTWQSIAALGERIMSSECHLPKEPLTNSNSTHWDTSIFQNSIEYISNDKDLNDLYEHQIPQSFEHTAGMRNSRDITQAPSLEITNYNENQPLSIFTMSNEANLSKPIQEARLLLNYYSERIIDVMSMSRTHTPPWKTIHLPCAMGTFADIIVHGKGRSLSKMALFYALLSISSFHISFSENNNNSLYWRERGELLKRKSKLYLHSALHGKMPKAARGKYKELLMSELSMVTIGVFSGNMQEVHAYLAASESLIRTEGLTKPVKSQKISKLHHIFSFLRIIHESTTLLERIYQGGSGCGQAQNNATQDNHHTSGSRLAWVEEEEPEDSEEDSLFVSIYQMPTTLLSLLSQTSSLYKQLHSPEGISATFGRRCQIIETRIFNWRAPKGLAFPNYDEAGESKTSATLSRDIAAHLVSATHYALIVHFQRQIRNTNPRLLQHYVTAAIDHLLVHEQLKKSNQISSAPFPWPGFIVGCEAYDIASREKMNIYLSTVRSYNLGSLLKSEKVVYEVWKRQDSSRSDGHWEDVLRDWDMQLVLT